MDAFVGITWHNSSTVLSHIHWCGFGDIDDVGPDQGSAGVHGTEYLQNIEDLSCHLPSMWIQFTPVKRIILFVLCFLQ